MTAAAPITANPAVPWLSVSRSLEFLRREMAPTPERWQATVRIALACMICIILIMAFHLKQPAMVMIGMFMVTKDDLSTTLFGTVLAIVAAIVTCGLLLLYYMCVLDLTWLRVLCVPAFIGLGLLMMRVVNPSILGLGVAICVGFGITIPDTTSDLEILNRTPFQYCWAWILGLSVNLGVQCLMKPQTSRSLLVRGLISRLEAVEALLRGLAAGEEVERSRSSIAALAFGGAAQQLRLLEVAGAIDPLLKKRGLEFNAQIILVDRLVTAASVLEVPRNTPGNEAVKKRLLWLAEACAAWRRALPPRRPPEIPAPPIERSTAAADPGWLPALAEMERVIELLPLATRGENLPDELKLPPHKKSGFLAPDAFTNPEHIHFAIKGMIAGTICYLIFTLCAYPAIYTSVITVILCSLSTVGASAQKGVLRFAGAVVGGALGFISLMYIFPHLDSIGGYCVVFGAVMALAAYVNFGSVRISYVGIQICLAFCKCALQTYGTYTELKVARDRLTGIALGLLVFGLINSRLWPVRALEAWRARLSDVFRQLARLASLPDEGASPLRRMAEAYSLRLKVYQDFGIISEMREGSKFESGGELRKGLEALDDEAKSLTLHLLAIIQHRPDLRPDAVPERLCAASLHFRSMLAGVLENLSERVQGKPERPWPDLEAELAEIEKTFALEIKNVANANVVARLHGRLALYKEIVPLVGKLTRLET
jgi:multidrug resistance protein MdtO